MTKLQAIKWFAGAVANDKVEITHCDEDDWGLFMDKVYPRLAIPNDLMLITETDKLFRKFFINKCSLANGFAHVTLSILHEIGHHFNREIYIEMDDEEYKQATGEEHFSLPCELVATEWAIEWLQDKSHRRLAKQFEKEFFGH